MNITITFELEFDSINDRNAYMSAIASLIIEGEVLSEVTEDGVTYQTIQVTPNLNRIGADQLMEAIVMEADLMEGVMVS